MGEEMKFGMEFCTDKLSLELGLIHGYLTTIFERGH